jgi:cob(I)alamin adenosyltransferase
MKIYTKTGDKGTTKLVDGRECSKASLRVETYGAVDELNSVLGLCISELNRTSVKDPTGELQKIQNHLFNIGSHLACEKEETRQMLPVIDEAWIGDLEKSIDQMTSPLSELKNFILPGGSSAASFLHLGRTVCRRAERMVVRLIEEGTQNEETLRSLRYLNRLSDYLFVAARFVNQNLGIPDQIWQKS